MLSFKSHFQLKRYLEVSRENNVTWDDAKETVFCIWHIHLFIAILIVLATCILKLLAFHFKISDIFCKNYRV